MLKNKMKKIEKLSVLDSLDRILAQDIFADRDEPACNVSPVDGIAFRTIDRSNALWEVGSIGLGDDPIGTISKNECLVVKKGAKLPQNADVVCMIDEVHNQDGQISIGSSHLYRAIKQGSTYKKGDLLLIQGHIIDTDAVVSFVKNNILELSVYCKLSIHIEIDTPYIDSDNFEIPDYKVRDYFTPYISSSLLNTYNVLSETESADIFIKIASNLETTMDILFEGIGFRVATLDDQLHILCMCDYKSIQSLVYWFEDQSFV